jgi:spermidine/putrescine transport system substrate-binding protein
MMARLAFQDMVRKFITFVLLGCLALPVMAQDTSQESTSPQPWMCPSGFDGQTLHVYNWTTYVAEDTISNFEKLCAVTVTYDTYDGMDALTEALGNGNPDFDIVVPSDYVIPDLINAGLLIPIDLGKIQNFQNVSFDLMNPWYDPGNRYTVPYQWGTIGIGYNHNKTGVDVTSWQQLFQYQGNVAWLEDKRSMLGIALKLLGFDPNSSKADEVNAAKQFLIDNSKNMNAIAPDDGQERLVRGEDDMVIEYSGDIFQKIDECSSDPNCKADYRYSVPQEGTIIWTDNVAIPKGAKNIPLAHAFIDYLLDPQVGADISNYTSYATPDQQSIDMKLIDEDLLNNTAIYPSEDVRKNLFKIQPDPTTESLYDNAWNEIKTALGK